MVAFQGFVPDQERGNSLPVHLHWRLHLAMTTTMTEAILIVATRVMVMAGWLISHADDMCSGDPTCLRTWATYNPVPRHRTFCRRGLSRRISFAGSDLYRAQNEVSADGYLKEERVVWPFAQRHGER